MISECEYVHVCVCVVCDCMLKSLNINGGENTHDNKQGEYTCRDAGASEHTQQSKFILHAHWPQNLFITNPPGNASLCIKVS